jgi:anti-sigma factor RsiW
MLQKLNEYTLAVMHRPGTIAEWEELKRKMHYLDGLPVSGEIKLASRSIRCRHTTSHAAQSRLHELWTSTQEQIIVTAYQNSSNASVPNYLVPRNGRLKKQCRYEAFPCRMLNSAF